jgi:hypothetical protein
MWCPEQQTPNYGSVPSDSYCPNRIEPVCVFNANNDTPLQFDNMCKALSAGFVPNQIVAGSCHDSQVSTAAPTTFGGCRMNDCDTNKYTGTDFNLQNGCCCTSGGNCASAHCDYMSWTCTAESWAPPTTNVPTTDAACVQCLAIEATCNPCKDPHREHGYCPSECQICGSCQGSDGELLFVPVHQDVGDSGTYLPPSHASHAPYYGSGYDPSFRFSSSNPAYYHGDAYPVSTTLAPITDASCRMHDCSSDMYTGSDFGLLNGCCCTSGGNCASMHCDYSTWTCASEPWAYPVSTTTTAPVSDACRKTDCSTMMYAGSAFDMENGCCCTSGGNCASMHCDYESWTCIADPTQPDMGACPSMCMTEQMRTACMLCSAGGQCPSECHQCSGCIGSKSSTSLAPPSEYGSVPSNGPPADEQCVSACMEDIRKDLCTPCWQGHYCQPVCTECRGCTAPFGPNS